jgi:hypothetical protein
MSTPALGIAAPSRTRASVTAPLAALAVAYVVLHHLGTLAAPLGSVGDTRWADWLDLLVPYLVLWPAALVLLRAQTDRTGWLLAGVGALVYTQGHGIHLAANSIGNVLDYGDVGHLWDEVVGHYVWYGGLALVVAALARTAGRLPRARGPWAWVLAVLSGLTWFTNGVEGATPVFSLVLAAAATAWAWRVRDRLGAVLLVAAATGTLLLAGFGLWQGGFPEFTELGWI